MTSGVTTERMRRSDGSSSVHCRRRDGGYLVTVDREVDPYLEIARLAAELDGRPVLFTRVKGSAFPVVAGVCSDRRYFGLALGVPADQVMFRLADALAAASPQPLP